MLDLMAEGNALWTAAETADSAESAQRRAVQVADELRIGCGKQGVVEDPQGIRSSSAPPNPHGYEVSAESAESAAPVSFEQCIHWIRDACPLLPADLEYVCRRLAVIGTGRAPTAALWYINAWTKAAEAEPVEHKKDNAGRRAANAVLSRRGAVPLPEITPKPQRQLRSPKLLKDGQRMAWTVVLGNKRLTMAGVAMSYQQALEAAQARWPGAEVEK